MNSEEENLETLLDIIYLEDEMIFRMLAETKVNLINGTDLNQISLSYTSVSNHKALYDILEKNYHAKVYVLDGNINGSSETIDTTIKNIQMKDPKAKIVIYSVANYTNIAKELGVEYFDKSKGFDELLKKQILPYINSYDKPDE